MATNIKRNYHKVEALTSGQPSGTHSLERLHSYKRGASRPELRERILAGLPSWEDEERALNRLLRAAGKRA